MAAPSVLLSDVLGTERATTIFAGFTRDVDSVSQRLDSKRENSTVLAPSNSALHDLPHKPWEDPAEYSQMGAEAYQGQAGEDRAARNLRRFTEAHIVPVSPWIEGEKVKTLGGKELWWESNQEDKTIIQPVNLEVEKIISRVANGEVWMVNGVLSLS
ncbi:FAS1 domain-containing protein [Piedraia hortae CBS 480.64]|uniref:FAS1 domain-containing protein n=1 Tax=Piedraia hortae CBS 480.64 TaxID=1314780 RepID=A0A6A7C3X6_9PEZI|nr:FAS1 domain-containing protein [Piedraia hortae CBS 480.64]